MISSLLNATVDLIKADGQQFTGIEASVQSKMILIPDATLPIEEGDRIKRVLPNGLIETYAVLDRGFVDPGRMSGGIKAHYQVKVRKETDPASENYRSTQIGTYIAGDQFNQSGDFRGANIKSTLSDVSQKISNISADSSQVRDQLEKLLAELVQVLEQVPLENGEEAEAIAETAKTLVDAATAERPNKTLISISGEGLKKAAENLASITPTILPIAIRIVEAIQNLK